MLAFCPLIPHHRIYRCMVDCTHKHTPAHTHTIHIINKCFTNSRKVNICHHKTFKASTLINHSASNIGRNSDVAISFMGLTSLEVHNQFLGYMDWRTKAGHV